MNAELDARLSALLDGELAPEEAAALRAEIARSPELAEQLAALAAVDEALRELPSRPAPAHVRERVRAELRARPRRRAGRWLAGAALAAAAAALALLALPRTARDERPIARRQPAPDPRPPVEILRPEPSPPPRVVAPAPLIAGPEPTAAPAAAESEDLPVIEVLDLLAELDELETRGSG